jgi:hypothetical protein
MSVAFIAKSAALAAPSHPNKAAGEVVIGIGASNNLSTGTFGVNSSDISPQDFPVI